LSGLIARMLRSPDATCDRRGPKICHSDRENPAKT
jgi:hypothetical protein